MRKLIEELQTEIERRDLKEAALEGLFLALQIVKAHDPWIDISEELPPPYKQEPSRSIEVLILTEDGNIYTGVYDYEQKAFFILNRRSIAKEIKWTYLPEAKS